MSSDVLACVPTCLCFVPACICGAAGLQLLTLAASVWVSVWVDPHSVEHHHSFPASLWKQQVRDALRAFQSLPARAGADELSHDAQYLRLFPTLVAPLLPPLPPLAPPPPPHKHRQHSQVFYAQVYAIIVGIMSVFGLLRMVGMALGALRAATQLHNGMVSALLRTTCRFYDLNPVGRIMNRCGVMPALLVGWLAGR